MTKQRHQAIGNRQWAILLNLFITLRITEEALQNLKPIVVYLHPHVKRIIKTWGNKSPGPEHYIFSILKEGLTPEQVKQNIH